MWTKYMYEKGGLMFEYPMHNFDVAPDVQKHSIASQPPLRTPLHVDGKGILATNACPQIARSEISPYRNTKPIGVHHIYMVKLPLSLPDKGGLCADPQMCACGARWVRPHRNHMQVTLLYV